MFSLFALHALSADKQMKIKFNNNYEFDCTAFSICVANMKTKGESIYSIVVLDGTGLKLSDFVMSTELSSLNFLNISSLDASELVIPDNQFKDFKSLTQVAIVQVQKIGAHAFAGITGLHTVNIPTAQQIGEGAFSGCTSLKHISFDNVYLIESEAFSGTGSDAEEFKFPGLYIVQAKAFQDSKVKKIDLSNAILLVGSNQFEGCACLEELKLSGLKILKDSTNDLFKGCINLTKLEFPANPPEGVANETFAIVNNTVLKIELPAKSTWDGNYASECTVNGDYEFEYKGYHTGVIDTKRRFNKKVLPFIILGVVLVVLIVGGALGFFFWRRYKGGEFVNSQRLV